ncbi:hypothetical protein V3M78_06680 [Trueperella pyogenes]|uniref:hypothetical protein n=1 Tax=Trueperella pyogenes TaxID=1661 RepID=UPI00345DBDCD
MSEYLHDARPWFAWRPVKTCNRRWAWLKAVIRHWQPGMLIVPGSHGYWEYTMPTDVTYTKRPHAGAMRWAENKLKELHHD